jgi:hypothetical protein
MNMFCARVQTLAQNAGFLGRSFPRTRGALSWRPRHRSFAMTTSKSHIDNSKLDRIVADARRNAEQRDLGYREQALKMYPWICGRCAREFMRANLQELTVHHRNHDHWELLCVYCHDNEHSRYIDFTGDSAQAPATAAATSNPFADLKNLLKRKD